MNFERREFRGQKKTRKLPFMLIGVIFVLTVAAITLWFRAALGPVDSSTSARVSVVIPSGATSGEIATLLKQADVITGRDVFLLYIRFSGRDQSLRAGSYVLGSSMTMAEVVDVLTGGAAGEVSITIPEGFTVADIDRMMAAKGFAATGAIIACAKTCDFSAFTFLPASSDGPGGRVEGYLYPDTYFVGGEASDPQALLSRLLSTFDAKVTQGLAAEIAASGRPLHEIMTMASLIEEEAANDSERAIISGILWKRLDEGIVLGVDAAVRYAVQKEPREPLTRADLESDSPYNIRVRAGLPPGPIANPGLASIEAALKPEASPYYYYLHGTDGQIRYARTNDEHNQNKAKYLN